jgi:Alpha/beta hydrolase domain
VYRPAACVLALGFLLCGLTPQVATARIVRMEIVRSEPAFDGQPFGNTGAYERLTAQAYGEVDPADPHNAIIQDLRLAPRNARGMVEYVTSVEILKPIDMARGNHVLFLELANRGNKTALAVFDDGIPASSQFNALTAAGDGYLVREGYTLVWFGWQQDVLPGNGRMVMGHVVAHNPDGSPITGIVRAEMSAPRVTVAKPGLPISASWLTLLSHDSYPSASLNNRTPYPDGFLPSLTVRARENEPRRLIPNTDWTFARCTEGGQPTPDEKSVCYPSGFQPGLLYELTYRAKDPLVMGLGFAVARDLGSFLRSARADAAGSTNPVYQPNQVAILEGTSQSGRMIRTFLHLGFNQDESGTRVFDGAFPHIGGGMIALNIRFAQPGHAWGEQIDHLYPAYDFPFTYAHQRDPLTDREQGLLDRCTTTDTCPRIFHVATALEMWEGRQSLGLTDTLGRTDVADPPNVRTFIMASTEHVPAPVPLAGPGGPSWFCQQQLNPNPQRWTVRALLHDFIQWVRDGVPPPNSVIPRIADGLLVPSDAVRFPAIPANNYGGVERVATRLMIADALHVLDFGPEYDAANSSGIISINPPRIGSAAYGVLVPQVDADGNDIGGIRSVFLQVPVGTYTGWNPFQSDFFSGGQCNLGGSFTLCGDPRRARGWR